MWPGNNWERGKEAGQRDYALFRFDRLADWTKGEAMRLDVKLIGFQPQRSGSRLRPDVAGVLLADFRRYCEAPIVTPYVRPAKASKRLAIGAKLRFYILNRDAYTCAYCGRTAKETELHVDHIISQKEWRERFGDLITPRMINGVELTGVNDERNLCAACSTCNLGKSDTKYAVGSASTLVLLTTSRDPDKM